MYVCIRVYIYQHTGDFKFATRQCWQEFEEEAFTGVNHGALSGKQSGNSCENESNLLTQHLHFLHMPRVRVPLTNTGSLVPGEHSETISKSYSLSKEWWKKFGYNPGVWGCSLVGILPSLCKASSSLTSSTIKHSNKNKSVWWAWMDV